MIVDVQEGCFSGMVFTVGRLVGVKQFIGSEVICEAGFDNTFYYFGYEREVRDWIGVSLSVRQLSNEMTSGPDI